MRSRLVFASLVVASRAFAQSADPPPEPGPATEPGLPAPVVETPPPVGVQPAPRHEHTPEDEPMKAWSAPLSDRGLYVGLEVGGGSFADSKSIYKAGLGRGVVLGYRLFEFRAEQYDLTDRSGMYTNVAHGDGIATITSLARRIPLAATEMVQASALVGAAFVSRPSMIAPDEGDPSVGAGFRGDQVAKAQWGLGVLLAAGITLGGVLYADVRIYPTYWSAISGTRLEYDDTTHTTSKVAVTNDTSPGGLPITFNAGVGWSF
ncbi:hypothetical protein BH11MYX1_BH11MYX1_39950 [soil metagenome]